MKRILAGLLALTMICSTAVFASAVTGDNAITGVSDDFYLVDDDGYVDLTTAAGSIPYGETAYFPLLRRGNYVTTSAVVDKIKVTDKWTENGTYVSNVEVVSAKLSADSEKLAGVNSRRIYCLAIETKQKNATKDQDLFGRVTLKQTTGDKEYRFDEIAIDIALELGYVSASKSEGEGIIPIKPASFSKRDGFEEESDFTFEFAADSDASFVVNTSGQGTIVLGMNIDFDDDIGDEYPTADLYFYNGNYAQFNRTGTLYLPGPSGDEGDYYVYSIDSKGKLSRVDADWDDYEECYAIRTNVLGRYVLSDKRLSTSSASSSSSQASSSSSSSELVVVPPPASSAPPASSYTPPVSSSVAPPPSSSTPPASSSTPSSSEPESEPEEESEPESEPEEEESEPEEIVDVDTEPDDSDGPEKSGIGTFIWVLIIVALLAVAAAVGFVLYASRGGSPKKKSRSRRSAPRSSRSRRRDDYDDYDDEDEYDDYDDDDSDFRR